jgi:hypothetical protein
VFPVRYVINCYIIFGRKLQTHPLVREGCPRQRAKQLSGKRKEKEKSGLGPQRGHNINSTQLNSTQLIRKEIIISQMRTCLE